MGQIRRSVFLGIHDSLDRRTYTPEALPSETDCYWALSFHRGTVCAQHVLLFSFSGGRSELLKGNFILRIGPNDQVRNVVFQARPHVRTSPWDDHPVSLGDSPGNTAVNAGASEVRPISEVQMLRSDGLSQSTAGHQNAGTFEHVINLGDFGLLRNGRERRSLGAKDAELSNPVASSVDDADRTIAIAVARRFLQELL